jgi:uncharacterized protein
VRCVTGSDIAVRLTPRAYADEIIGERDGVLRVRVSAPPLDDRANDALRRLIARRVGIRTARVTIVRGAHARDKLVRVEGLSGDALACALADNR